MNLPMQSAGGFLDRWGSRLIVVCATVTAVNFIGLGIALVLISGQASQGQRARDLQVARQPISDKVYRHQFEIGVITAADLACFKDSRRCPVPTK